MASNSSVYVLLEGFIKYRDNRKWKSRWAVVSQLSPVADCLYVHLYRNCKDKIRNIAPKSAVVLDGYLGIESGFTLDREANTLAIICKTLTVVFSFDTREILFQWQQKLQSHFCKEQHYLVHIISLPNKSKLTCGPARLLLQDFIFCLVSGIPPRLLLFWPLKQLRRFGSVDGKFCFEGGSQCGKGAGLHVLYTNQSEDLSKCFELASNGQLNSLSDPSNDSNRFYSKQNQKFLYGTKYEDNNGNNSKGRKSTSSDSSSTCDSCSNIVSTLDDNASNYYANSASSQTQFYHSSINLSHQNTMHYCSSASNVCSVNGSFSAYRNPSHGSVRGASHKCVCHSAPFSSNTVCRSSNVNGDIARCVPCEHHAHQSHLTECGHNRPGNLLTDLSSAELVKIASSPSTSTVSNCMVSSDRESLFSQSSHGSSNSSSGCSLSSSAFSYTDHNRFINPHLHCSPSQDSNCELSNRATLIRTRCAHHDQQQHINHRGNDYSSISKCLCSSPVEQSPKEDIGRDEFINGCQCGGTEQLAGLNGQSLASNVDKQEQLTSHLYSVINFRNKIQESSSANYDVPKNVCVNASLLNQNNEASANQKAKVVNHCNCDMTRLNNAPNGDGIPIKAHNNIGSASVDDKSAFLPAIPASDAPFNNSIVHHQHYHRHQKCARDNGSTHCACHGQATLKPTSSWEHHSGKDGSNQLPDAPQNLVSPQSSPSQRQECLPNDQASPDSTARHNYVNLEFMQSIGMYQNLCFNNKSPISTLDPDIAVVTEKDNMKDIHADIKDDCSLITEHHSKEQCASNCLPGTQNRACDRCNNDEDTTDSASGGESQPSGVDSHQHKTVEVSDIQKSMNTSAWSESHNCGRMAGEQTCECDSGGTGEERTHTEIHLDRKPDKVDEGCSCANSANTLSSASQSLASEGCTNDSHHNGDHYRAEEKANAENELNISLSSLNNRTGPQNSLRKKNGPSSKGRTLGKSSIANLISRSKQQKHRCRRSLLREKSYSIDDITSIENYFKFNNTINTNGTGVQNESCASQPEIGRHKSACALRHHNREVHKSDQLLNVITKKQIFNWTSITDDCCSSCESDTDSEDFCTSSQITVLCQNQS